MMMIDRIVDQMGNGVKRAEKEVASGEWRVTSGEKEKKDAAWRLLAEP